MKRLILVRHAVTDDNELAKLSGYTDSTISENGKKQIDQLTKYLREEKIDKIYTTTSSRTKDTVSQIIENNLADVFETKELAEINFGDFEGKDFEYIQKNHPEEFDKMIEEGYKYKYPNGESLIECYDRVSKEISSILQKDKSETILICSHGGTIRNILTYLISNTLEYHWNFKIDNASVSIVEIDNGFAVIEKLNDTSFLK